MGPCVKQTNFNFWAKFALQYWPYYILSQERTRVQEDIRSTQEIFGDLFGGLASLGARGVDGFVIAKALARLLIQQGVIRKDIFIATMRDVAQEELEESDELTNFLSEAFAEVIANVQERERRVKGTGTGETPQP